MCGITGIYHFDNERHVDRDKLRLMTDIIRHRGPDGEGFYIENNIGLGHRRLSIIDIDTGDQPMFSDNKQIVIVFNGEIYNYIELREELKRIGYNFQTDSDTEVVIKAYEEWGYNCQDKFNGMWSFALWDKKKQELFLSRDRIGEKPLHYAIYGNSIVFGSEMKSLFAYGIPKNIDYSLMELYLVLTNIPEPFSFYKDIKKLKAGHYIVIKNGVLNEFKYWDLPEIDESNMIKDKEAVYKEFEYLFRDSIKIRMRSDVPFGAFLSGGLDSSSVVSIMSELVNYPIKTFTIGFPERAFDESKLAQDVADKFNTKHFSGTVHPNSFDDILKNTSYYYDEPFGDSSAIPTGYVSQYAKQHVKMVLTGDGGDETLSGYNSYLGIKVSEQINKIPPLFLNSFLFFNGLIARYTSGSIRYRSNKVESVIKTAKLGFNDRIAQKSAYTKFETIKALVFPINDLIKIEDYLYDFMSKSGHKKDFYKLMYFNFKHSLPNDYLVKVDRMSMANSLETRLPFLDYRLIEFMCKVDKGVKMQGWEKKSILRKTVGQTLPKSIQNAPKKGFGIPLREWFKDDLFNSHINENLYYVKELLLPEIVNQIVDENKLGKRDNGNFIWGLMMLNQAIKNESINRK